MFLAEEHCRHGDTPKDVEAAHAGGARIVAVATGKSSAENLTRARADHVLPDLTDLARLRRVLNELTGQSFAAIMGSVAGPPCPPDHADRASSAHRSTRLRPAPSSSMYAEGFESLDEKVRITRPEHRGARPRPRLVHLLDEWNFRGAQDAALLETRLALGLRRELTFAEHVNLRALSGLSGMALILGALGGPPGVLDRELERAVRRRVVPGARNRAAQGA